MENTKQIQELEKKLRGLKVQKAILYSNLSEKITTNENYTEIQVVNHGDFNNFGITCVLIKNLERELLRLTKNIMQDEETTQS